jgi:lysozyme family protein
MSNFLPICRWVIEQEDRGLTGVVKNLMDGGGRTRFGITEHFNPGVISSFFTTTDIMLALTYAETIYKKTYWDRFFGDAINSDQVASCLLSFSINDGTSREVKMLQACLGFPAYEIDGIVGPNTLLHVNAFGDIILSAALRAAQVDFYRALVDKQPTDIRFLDGWLKRAARIYPNLD